MRFPVVSEEEAAAQSGDLFPAGEYDYEIKDAEEKTSSTGNEMIALEVWIFAKDGGRKLLFDYLVSGEKSAWKARMFAASCGMIKQYETGDLMVAEIVGRTGRCAVVVQPARGEYGPKNTISKYIKAAAGTGYTGVSAPRPAASREKAPAGDIDDEIPF